MQNPKTATACKEMRRKAMAYTLIFVFVFANILSSFAPLLEAVRLPLNAKAAEALWTSELGELSKVRPDLLTSHFDELVAQAAKDPALLAEVQAVTAEATPEAALAKLAEIQASLNVADASGIASETVDEAFIILNKLAEAGLIEYVDEANGSREIANPNLVGYGDLTTESTQYSLKASTSKPGYFQIQNETNSGAVSVGYVPFLTNETEGITAENKVLHKDIWNNTDLLLTTTPEGVKEDLILKNENAPREFAYGIALEGLVPSLTDTGALEYLDANGEVQMYVPAPVIYDVNGEERLAEYQLLTVSEGEAWLNAQDENIEISNLHYNSNVQEWGYSAIDQSETVLETTGTESFDELLQMADELEAADTEEETTETEEDLVFVEETVYPELDEPAVPAEEEEQIVEEVIEEEEAATEPAEEEISPEETETPAAEDVVAEETEEVVTEETEQVAIEEAVVEEEIATEESEEAVVEEEVVAEETEELVTEETPEVAPADDSSIIEDIVESVVSIPEANAQEQEIAAETEELVTEETPEVAPEATTEPVLETPAEETPEEVVVEEEIATEAEEVVSEETETPAQETTLEKSVGETIQALENPAAEEEVVVLPMNRDGYYIGRDGYYYKDGAAYELRSSTYIYVRESWNVPSEDGSLPLRAYGELAVSIKKTEKPAFPAKTQFVLVVSISEEIASELAYPLDLDPSTFVNFTARGNRLFTTDNLSGGQAGTYTQANSFGRINRGTEAEQLGATRTLANALTSAIDASGAVSSAGNVSSSEDWVAVSNSLNTNTIGAKITYTTTTATEIWAGLTYSAAGGVVKATLDKDTDHEVVNYIDTYNSTTLTEQKTLIATGLTSDTHTVELELVPMSNSARTGSDYLLTLDYLETYTSGAELLNQSRISTATATLDASHLTDSTLTAADDYYNGYTLTVLSGASEGNVTYITDYTQADTTLEFVPTLNSSVVSGTTYRLTDGAILVNGQILNGLTYSASTTPNGATYSALNNINSAAGTLSLWVKPDFAYNADAATHEIFTTEVAKLYYDGADDEFHFAIFDGTDWSKSVASASQDFVPGDVIYLNANWSNTVGLKLYVDNILTNTTTTWTEQTVSGDIVLGASFAGVIAETQIFDYAMRKVEVYDIYYATTPAINKSVDQFTALNNQSEDALLFNAALVNTPSDTVGTLVGGAMLGDTVSGTQLMASGFYGTGTLGDPYIISNCTDLQNMQNDLDAYYSLANDINCSETSTWNSGAGFDPVGAFVGVFDGNGYTIKNLYINRPAESAVGLFSQTNGSSTYIKNVGLENVNITGASNTGGLVGTMDQYSHATNCYVTGDVTGSTYSGGFVGYPHVSSTIDNSYVDINFTATGTESGGFVGRAEDNVTITNSYALGTVTLAGGESGGFMGISLSSTVTNCYSDVYVTAPTGSLIGGLVGRNLGTVTNSYAVGDVNYSGASGTSVNILVGGNTGTITNSYYWSGATCTNCGTNPLGTAEATLANLYSSSHAVYTGTPAWDFSTPLWYEWSASTPRFEEEPTMTGSGTSEDPYMVFTCANFQAMQNDLDAYYELGGDIDCAETSTWNSGAGFDPVGSSSTPFTGSFDGKGYTISDLYINRPSEGYISLFGATNGSTIQNVGIEDVDITGYVYVGALVGNHANSSTISNCYSTGNVAGLQSTYTYVGGLVANNYNGSTIENSYSAVNVSGPQIIGGLAGQNYYADSVITDSYARGTVTASSSYVGGFVGINQSAYITNSYVIGDVTGTTYVAGLAGYNYEASITNSYAAGDVSGTSTVGLLTTWNYNGTITNSYYYSGASCSGCDNTYGTAEATLSNLFSTSHAVYTGTPAWDFSTPDWYAHSDYFPTFEAWSTPPARTGSGTQADPYVLYSCTQVQDIANNLSAYYELGADVDCTMSRTWNSGAGFDPIGQSSPYFTGSFDGKGYTISNLYINRPGESKVGLFGQLDSGATISNLGLENVDITGNDKVGGMLGHIFQYSGTVSVSDSYVTGTVTGTSSVGGFMGYVQGSSSIQINRCYSEANVSGSGSTIGGFVAGSEYVVVSDSYATGSVSNTGSAVYTGGFIGSNYAGVTINCYSSGDATSNYTSLGGFAGMNYSGTITNSFSTSAVNYTGGSSSSSVGPLIGSTQGTLTNSYYYSSATCTNCGNTMGTAEANPSSFYRSSHSVYNGSPAWDFSTTWVEHDSKLPDFEGESSSPDPSEEIIARVPNKFIYNTPANTTEIVFGFDLKPDAGIVRVIVDAGTSEQVITDIDTYSLTEQTNKRFLIATGLTPAVHTVKVKQTGFANPSSTDDTMYPKFLETFTSNNFTTSSLNVNGRLVDDVLVQNSTFVNGVTYPAMGNISSSEGTLEFWASNGTLSASQTLVTTRDASNLNGLAITTDGSSNLVFTTTNASTSVSTSAAGSANYNPTQANHILARWYTVGTDFVMSLYLNGTKISETKNTFTPSTHSRIYLPNSNTAIYDLAVYAKAFADGGETTGTAVDTTSEVGLAAGSLAHTIAESHEITVGEKTYNDGTVQYLDQGAISNPQAYLNGRNIDVLSHKAGTYARLNGALTSGTTSISIDNITDDTAIRALTGFAYIGSAHSAKREKFYYESYGSGVFSGVVRGVDGTSAAAWADDTIIEVVAAVTLDSTPAEGDSIYTEYDYLANANERNLNPEKNTALAFGANWTNGETTTVGATMFGFARGNAISIVYNGNTTDGATMHFILDEGTVNEKHALVDMSTANGKQIRLLSSDLGAGVHTVRGVVLIGTARVSGFISNGHMPVLRTQGLDVASGTLLQNMLLNELLSGLVAVNSVRYYEPSNEADDSWRKDNTTSWYAEAGEYPRVSYLIASDSALFIFDQNTNLPYMTFVVGEGNAIDTTINSVDVKNGVVYIATDNGLVKLDFVNDTISKIVSGTEYGSGWLDFSDRNLTEFAYIGEYEVTEKITAIDAADGILAIGTENISNAANSKVYLYDTTTGLIDQTNSAGAKVTAVFADENANLYYATASKVVKFSEGSAETTNSSMGAHALSSDGNYLYAGTDNGLAKLSLTDLATSDATYIAQTSATHNLLAGSTNVVTVLEYDTNEERLLIGTNDGTEGSGAVSVIGDVSYNPYLLSEYSNGGAGLGSSQVLAVDSAYQVAQNSEVARKGIGSESDPYILYTCEQLQEMSNDLTAYYELGRNIDCSETTTWDSGAGFLPVGDSTTQFSGSFDGKGHTISNLYISRTGSSQIYTGLFGYVNNGGYIKNVGLIDPDVTGYTITGALAGQIQDASVIDNCYVEGGTVVGDTATGGLLGYINQGATKAPILVNSHSSATVSSTLNASSSRVGGLVGTGATGAIIKNSYATGDVTSNTSHAGGLVGHYNGAYLYNSYASGNVTGNGDYVGGLVAYSYSSYIYNSFATGDVTGGASYTATTGRLIGGNSGAMGNDYYYSGSTCTNCGSVNGAAEADLTAFYSASHGVYTDNLPTWNFGTIWRENDSTLPTYGNVEAGNATAEHPELIYSCSDLQNISGNLAGSYKLALSIDCTETSTWNSGAGFDPIGNDSTPFTGTFDGNGKTISNFFINRPTTNNVGLFGYTNGSTIQNTHLRNADVTAQSYSGTLVGFNYNGSVIDNCSSTGIMDGADIAGSVGGLVGDNNTNATISNSYADVQTHGGGNATGGLVGYNRNSATIENSYANGDVTAENQAVGGLTGRNEASSVIQNSYATGNVIGVTDVAGLTGTNSVASIQNSYATGNATGEMKVAGFVGMNSNADITNSYATGNITGSNANIGGFGGQIQNGGNLTNVFAVGNVTNNSTGYESSTGLFAGVNSATLTNSYYYSGATCTNCGSTYAIAEDTLTDFYSEDHEVYGSEVPYWDFGGAWQTGVAFPTLLNNPTGSGTESDPYLIYSCMGLQNIANNMTAGTYYALAQDVDCSDTVNWNSGAGFEPIGVLENKFYGNLDGQGYAISDLYINSSRGYNVGLFGYTSGSTIENLGLENASITANATQVGGIIGTAESTSKLLNSYVTGTIYNASKDTGGLVGWLTVDSRIKNAYADVDITGVGTSVVGSNVGGLVGLADSESKIYNTYAAGSVTGSYAGVGGLVGSAGSDVVITTSYAVDDVENTNTGYESTTGRLIGNNSTAPTDSYYYSGSTCTNCGSVNGISEDTLSDFYSVFHPVYNVDWLYWHFGGIWEQHDAALPTTTEKAAHGDGTENDPYQIYSCAGLQNMRVDLTGYYKIMNDIDCSMTASWNSGIGFEPIGDDTTKFTGSVDGQGYTISDFYINRPSESYMALFGYADGANIRNISLSNVDITGYEYVAGLAGEADNTTIYNAHTSGLVEATSSGSYARAGGLVAMLNSTHIYNSHSDADVTAYTCAGGLVGQNYQSAIYRSYATGDVTTTGNYAGGLVGYNNASTESIVDCYATGNVTSTAGGNVGGLAGYNYDAHIYNTYATGNVSGNGDYVGGLVGRNYSITVNNSYSTGDVSNNAAYSAKTGKFVGSNEAATITNSYYWAGATCTNCSFSAGTAEADKTNFYSSVHSVYTPGSNDWNFLGTWREEGNTYPTLRSLTEEGDNGLYFVLVGTVTGFDIVEFENLTSPGEPIVTDEGSTKETETVLEASWTADGDKIVDYEYCISSDETACDVGQQRNWTSTDGATSVTATGLELTPNVTYYFHVKAKNDADLWSSVGHSDGILTTVPVLAPNAPILVNPADGSYTTNTTPTLSARYSDDNVGDTGTTEYRVATTAAGCIDNSTVQAWGTSAETATNNVNTTWEVSSALSDATYYWCARNNDGEYTSDWTSMGSFTVDTTAPEVNTGAVEFAEIQDITTSYGFDTEYFEIGTDKYLAVANHYDGTNFALNSYIYKWDGDSFETYQTIATSGAYDWEYFEIGTDKYLAVANGRSGVSDYSGTSYVYKWDGDSFEIDQTFSSFGITDWVAFTIGTDNYLLMVKGLDGPPADINSNSVLYKWNTSTEDFEVAQNIAGYNPQDAEVFTIGSDTYVAFATGPTTISVFKWDGDSFEPDNNFTYNAVINIESYAIGSDTYLAASNNGGNVQTYKWNTSTESFDLDQSLALGFDARTFTIGSDIYIAVAGNTSSANTVIYKWDGDSFESEQTFSTPYGQDVEPFNMDGTQYLSIAMVYNDSTSSYTTDSTIYKFNANALISPNGGEELAMGMETEITWNPAKITDANFGATPIKLEYSLNSGSTWTVITEATENDGSYMWTTPETLTTQAQIRITATDLVSLSASDTSDTDFSLINPTPDTTEIISGNNQIGGIGEDISEMKVRIGNGSGYYVGENDIAVTYAITSAPTAPAAAGQELAFTASTCGGSNTVQASGNSITVYTDADGYACADFALGDRAGIYEITASFDDGTGNKTQTFTVVEREEMKLDFDASAISMNNNAGSGSDDSGSVNLSFTTNAASYDIVVTPDQWLTHSTDGTRQIANWDGTHGFAWDNNSDTTEPTAFSADGENPDGTVVYSCSGDACQGAQNITIDLHTNVDYSVRAGTYNATLPVDIANVTF